MVSVRASSSERGGRKNKERGRGLELTRTCHVERARVTAIVRARATASDKKKEGKGMSTQSEDDLTARARIRRLNGRSRERELTKGEERGEMASVSWPLTRPDARIFIFKTRWIWQKYSTKGGGQKEKGKDEFYMPPSTGRAGR